MGVRTPPIVIKFLLKKINIKNDILVDEKSAKGEFLVWIN